MARNVKSKRLDWSGMAMMVDKLELGCDKPSDTPDLVLVGTVSNAGTGAGSAAISTGGVAAKVFTVEIDGTTFYCPLYSTNA